MRGAPKAPSSSIAAVSSPGCTLRSASVSRLAPLASGRSLSPFQQQISSQVNSVWWKGPDADRFRNEWEGQFSAQLKKIAEALRQTGTIVRKQAQQQRQTSSA